MITPMDEFWLRVADDQASCSHDPSTKVGCVVIAANGSVSPGYNHFVSGHVPDTREERYAAVVHAEPIAMLQAGRLCNGATLYSTHEPCADCWKLVVASGIARVVCYQTSEDRRARWGCDGPGRAAFLERGGALEVHS